MTGVERIERRLERARREGVFPGASLLVGSAGEVIYARLLGHARLHPRARLLRRETRFDLASLTKALGTTTVAMLAVDDGAARLDEPLGTRLPLARPLADLTPWHLLAHTSGLPAWAPLYEALDRARREDPALASRDRARRWLRQRIADTPLEYEPGTRAVYSDLGFMVLEWWLERVFDQRIDRVLAARFLAPLGLRHTGYVDLDEVPPAPPGGYAATERCPWRGRVVEGEVHDHNSWAMGGISGQAGLFSVATDVHRMVTALWRAWCGQDGPVRPRTVRRFWQPSGVPGSDWRLGWDGPSRSGYSAAGARLDRAAVGHLGFTGGSLWVDPAAGLWIILLTNRIHPLVDNPRLRPFRPSIHDLVVEECAR